MKKHIALMFAASTLFLAGCCTAHQEHATTKWEYQTVYDISEVNKLSDQGWSLSGFSAFHDGGTSGTLYVMKHPKQ